MATKWKLGPDAPEDWVQSLGLPEGETNVELADDQELALVCAGWIVPAEEPKKKR